MFSSLYNSTDTEELQLAFLGKLKGKETIVIVTQTDLESEQKT